MKIFLNVSFLPQEGSAWISQEVIQEVLLHFLDNIYILGQGVPQTNYMMGNKILLSFPLFFWEKGVGTQHRSSSYDLLIEVGGGEVEKGAGTKY